MKKLCLLLILSLFSLSSISLKAQIPSKVNIDDYEKLVAEAKEHRKTHMLTLDQFNEEAKKEGVIILDARSDAMYNAKHIKGAVHLNFSDFTQENLAKIIPSYDTKILIYCNNNFDNDDRFFPTKMVQPQILNLQVIQNAQKKGETEKVNIIEETKENETKTGVEFIKIKPITLALNIPTYINLYGYGYRNVYELSEFISVYDSRLQFEGTQAGK